MPSPSKCFVPPSGICFQHRSSMAAAQRAIARSAQTFFITGFAGKRLGIFMWCFIPGPMRWHCCGQSEDQEIFLAAAPMPSIPIVWQVDKIMAVRFPRSRVSKYVLASGGQDNLSFRIILRVEYVVSRSTPLGQGSHGVDCRIYIFCQF